MVPDESTVNTNMIGRAVLNYITYRRGAMPPPNAGHFPVGLNDNPSPAELIEFGIVEDVLAAAAFDIRRVSFETDLGGVIYLEMQMTGSVVDAATALEVRKYRTNFYDKDQFAARVREIALTELTGVYRFNVGRAATIINGVMPRWIEEDFREFKLPLVLGGTPMRPHAHGSFQSPKSEATAQALGRVAERFFANNENDAEVERLFPGTNFKFDASSAELIRDLATVLDYSVEAQTRFTRWAADATGNEAKDLQRVASLTGYTATLFPLHGHFNRMHPGFLAEIAAEPSTGPGLR